MAKTKERQASTLTLAEKRLKAESLISQALSARASANSPASLDTGLAEGLADPLAAAPASARLGRPLRIREVAAMIGCSPWTVRQKLLRLGLPHFRSAASGKLIFYTTQVVRWIEHQQRKGGKFK